MLRTIGHILLILGNLLIIPGILKKYKESRDRLDLLELIGLSLMLPFLFILVIGQFI